MSADGNWKITLATPMGPQTFNAQFTTEGDVLKGSLASAMGNEEISGTAADNDLTWDMKITTPMPMTIEFAATVDGDAMSGTAKLGMFGNAVLTGERA